MDNQEESEMNFYDIIKWTTILMFVEILLIIREYCRARVNLFDG
jgi:hypothetical protein